MTLTDRQGAVKQLTRLYGRDRAIQAMRRTTLDARYGDREQDREIVIDLVEDPLSVEIDLRDEAMDAAAQDARTSSAPHPASTARAARVYGDRVDATASASAPAYWL